MYVPGKSGNMIFNEEMSVYGPRDHQRIISKLNVGLGQLYYREKSIRLEPLPETMVDEGEASPTPDMILLDNRNDQIPVVIEVCHSGGQKKDMIKVIGLIDEDYYGIQEAFVYNYKTTQWLRYSKGNAGQMIESSFSEVLQLDLNTFLI